ncbi:MAG: hypothetical protein HYV77_01265 [Candidatus Wildermuthbacteria bacterium]|nr:hypothetical protein [Candidatus Wildermuthbacteria bacterium]
MQVTIPTRRVDVSIPEDLIEEIGRIYGYEHIVEHFPAASLLAHEKNLNIFWQDQLRDALKTAGMTETYNLSFIGQADVAQFRYSEYEIKRLVELENPLSEDIKYMRPSLIENLAKNIALNQKKHPDIKLFEIGKIYFKESGRLREENEATGIMFNQSFYDIKGIVDFLFESLGIPGVWYDNHEQIAEREAGTVWHPKKSAEIKVGDKQIGFLGEISQDILYRFKITKPVCAFSLNFDAVSSLASEEKEYRPASRFPASIRDIAIIVPSNIRTVDIENLIETAGGELVEDVDIFDLYEGAKIGENKKSLAFHIIYQANDRTLTNEEVDQLHTKIISALEQNPEWEVR